MSDGTGDTMPHAPAQTAAAAISAPPGATVGASGTDKAAGGAETLPLDIGALADRANAIVAAHNHADLCHCDPWPTACLSGLTPATWETSAFDVALPELLAPLLSELTAARADNERLRGDVHRTSAALIAARAELTDLQHGMATYVRDRIGPVCAERDRALAELARYTHGTWQTHRGRMQDGRFLRHYDTRRHEVQRRVWTGPVEPITAEETPDHA